VLLFGADTSATLCEKVALASLRGLDLNFVHPPTPRDGSPRGLLGIIVFDAVDTPARFDSNVGKRHIRKLHSVARKVTDLPLDKVKL
jgi:hypothetical protein